jgi:hypothetical protein
MRSVPIILVLSLAVAPATLAEDGTEKAALAAVPTETQGSDQPALRGPMDAVEICGLLASEADARRLPRGFLARLIWQESRFNYLAVSPKGAQGIAQFMPGTAAERALADPFDIPSALAESAAFLEELHVAFGNLGLAAAAYNAGPERVRRWLSGTSGLPAETRHYVRTITGLSAEHWREGEVEAEFTLDDGIPFEESCPDLVLAGLPSAPRTTVREHSPPALPWGVQVTANASREVALASFARIQGQHVAVLGGKEPVVVRHGVAARGGGRVFGVRIGTETRQAADELCAKLRASGGACMVMRN